MRHASIDVESASSKGVADTESAGQISHSAEQRLNVSPLATVLQGGCANDSVQRLIHIAQNLSLQAPESPLGSPGSVHSPAAGANVPATNAMRAQSQDQQMDWKDRERGFLHRQLLHNMFFRHSCSTVAQDRSPSPSRDTTGAK